MHRIRRHTVPFKGLKKNFFFASPARNKFKFSHKMVSIFSFLICHWMFHSLKTIINMQSMFRIHTTYKKCTSYSKNFVKQLSLIEKLCFFFFFYNTFSMVKTDVNTSYELFCFYFSGFNSYSRQDIVLQKILQGLQYRLLSLTS